MILLIALAFVALFIFSLIFLTSLGICAKRGDEMVKRLEAVGGVDGQAMKHVLAGIIIGLGLAMVLFAGVSWLPLGVLVFVAGGVIACSSDGKERG